MRLYMLFFLFFLAGCVTRNDRPKVHGTTLKDSASSHQVRTVVVDTGQDEGWGGDFRLSIETVFENDSQIFVRALSQTPEGVRIGLQVVIPKLGEDRKGFGEGLVLTSIGKESDSLLSFMAGVYGVKIPEGSAFNEKLEIPFVNLDIFAKSMTNTDPATKGFRYYKLFLGDANKEEYAELYLNLDLNDWWLEFREKDEEYRGAVVQFLTK